MAVPDTLRWRNGRLELLDQRVLPDVCEYVICDSADTTAAAVRDMVVRGAPAIGCAAAYGFAVEALRLKDATGFDDGLSTAFDVLARSRPTAVNLSWALNRMRAHMERCRPLHTNQQIAGALLDEAHAITAEDIAANRRMGEFGAALLGSRTRVLTHCNAGALATAGHGTALGVIRSAHESGKNIEVYADETRPFLQGARLTAWELMQDGIPVTLITDSAAAWMMQQRRIDAIIVGADRIAANGDVANKIGTYSLAVLAKHHGIPLYVAAPCSTIDAETATGADIPIEERDAAEVRGYRTLRWAPEDVPVANPVFDVTPAGLVTAIITERGVIMAPGFNGIANLLSGSGPA